MRDLDRLFNPRTIAVIGGTPAARAIIQSDRLDFDGEIWPVHPVHETIEGRTAYRSLDDLPGVPDAAFVAVNRQTTVDTVHQLAAMGVGGAVLYASGFAEVGEEGAALQEKLVTGHDMPLIGPNCYGTINAVSGAAMWPDVQGLSRVESGPAFIGQSGNITLNMTMAQRGVDFAYAVSLGNQASVTVEECIAHMATDPAVTSIGIYLESIGDAVAFGEAALLAHHHRTPIVVLKAGRSRTSERIASTHTAAIAAPADAYDALFRRYGVVSVSSLPELMTTLSLLEAVGPLPGNRLVSLSCSGGEASVVADTALAHDVVFEPLTEEHAGRIAGTLNDLVAMTNPLDYHTFIWGDEAALEACFTEVLNGPVDAGMLVIDWPDEENDDTDWWPTVDAMVEASRTTGVAAIAVASLPENLPARVRTHLRKHGLGSAPTIGEALAALAGCAAVGTWFNSPPPPLHVGSIGTPPAVRVLDEVDAKHLLADAGIAIPEGVVTTEASPSAPNRFPVVAKITGQAHKSDRDGVVLGIADNQELELALRRLYEISDRVLVEEMVGDAVAEVLVSVRREGTIGLVCTVGLGGSLVELISDTTTVLLPEPDLDARLAGSRLDMLLDGHRGSAPGDRASLAHVVAALTDLMESRPDIREIEINPLIVTPTGAVAVDALVEIGDD